MNHSIKAALGIKDQHLELDLKCREEPIADYGSKIIVHLVQTYPLTCPIMESQCCTIVLSWLNVLSQH